MLSDRCFPLILFTCLWNLFFASNTSAQITPDNSLGDENSQVIPSVTVKETLVDLIEGGAIRDNNLFHSFSEFNVEDGAKVYFAAPSSIANILTRVTGDNISQIFGTLGVDGAANLFLLNPNGIVFGENAQLDIAGSFLATTADSYVFNNNFVYSATNPEIPPLLTVKIPLGLQLGTNPGAVVNKSRFSPNDSTIQGLSVSPQQTLSLIGGEVILEAGYLTTSRGNIQLGAVAANNRVNLIAHDSGWQINFQPVTAFADIKITQHGGINGGQLGGSEIELTGKNIILGYDWESLTSLNYGVEDFFTLKPLPYLDRLPDDRITISAHNQDNPISSQISITASDTFSLIDPGASQSNIVAHTYGTGDAGAIEIVADTIVMYGGSVESSTEIEAAGNSGSVNFTAQNMSVQNGGAGVNTYSRGDGGAIALDIANELKIQSGGFGAEVRDIGNGGTINISAANLEIRFGGAGVNTYGRGDGGAIALDIANELKIQFGGFGADALGQGDGGTIGINAKNISLNGAGMGVNTRDIGKGGEINIKAETISFKDGIIGAESGANIDERNFDLEMLQPTLVNRDAGDGGDISIEANALLIDNANISTSTVGNGNAGNVEIKVDFLELVGGELVTGIDSSTDGAGSGGQIKIDSDRVTVINGARIGSNSTNSGSAGDIELTARDTLQLESGGLISVDGGSLGTAGNINISTDSMVLKDEGKISATVDRGTGGNIRLYANNLSLRDRSEITATARQDATGGNITINLEDNLIGLENSQIAASAERGQGGNIQINTRGLFLSADSSINASSEFGIDGVIQIETLAINPDSGIIQFPQKPIDPDLYLSTGCGEVEDNRFVSVGRGGLPEVPLNNVINTSVSPDLEIPPSLKNRDRNALDQHITVSPHQTTIEAQTWKINQNGKIELYAVSPYSQSDLIKFSDRNCLAPGSIPSF